MVETWTEELNWSRTSLISFIFWVLHQCSDCLSSKKFCSTSLSLINRISNSCFDAPLLFLWARLGAQSRNKQMYFINSHLPCLLNECYFRVCCNFCPFICHEDVHVKACLLLNSVGMQRRVGQHCMLGASWGWRHRHHPLSQSPQDCVWQKWWVIFTVSTRSMKWLSQVLDGWMWFHVYSAELGCVKWKLLPRDWGSMFGAWCLRGSFNCARCGH